MHQQLIERGFSVGVNRVRSCMREPGLKTIYPTKAVKTTLANATHRKYPYLLKDIVINRANQVWSTDITYVHVNGRFMYLSDHKLIKALGSRIDSYITFYNCRRFHQSLNYEKSMKVYHTRS